MNVKDILRFYCTLCGADFWQFITDEIPYYEIKNIVSSRCKCSCPVCNKTGCIIHIDSDKNNIN